jgi:hypothetical protein
LPTWLSRVQVPFPAPYFEELEYWSAGAPE